LQAIWQNSYKNAKNGKICMRICIKLQENPA